MKKLFALLALVAGSASLFGQPQPKPASQTQVNVGVNNVDFITPFTMSHYVPSPSTNPTALGSVEFLVGKSNSLFGYFTPGTTTEGIQEAINWAGQATNQQFMVGGCEVHIGPGHYEISSQLVIRNGNAFTPKIVGAGWSTIVEYTNTVRQDMIVSSPNTNAFQMGDPIFRDIAFLYKHGEFTNLIFNLPWVDAPKFENCMFGTSDTYLTNKILALRNTTSPRGVAGGRINNANACVFDHCSFYGLSFGVMLDGATISFKNCDFVLVGSYYNTNTADYSYTNNWTFPATYTEKSLFSLGAAVCNNNVATKVTLDDCDFPGCNAYFAGGPDFAGAIVLNPHDESVHYSVLLWDTSVGIVVGLNSLTAPNTVSTVTNPRTITGITPQGFSQQYWGVPLGGFIFYWQCASNTIETVTPTGDFTMAGLVTSALGFNGNGRPNGSQGITNATFTQKFDYTSGGWITNNTGNEWTVGTVVKLVGTNVAGNVGMEWFMNNPAATSLAVALSNGVNIRTASTTNFVSFTNFFPIQINVPPGASATISNITTGTGNSATIDSGSSFKSYHP